MSNILELKHVARHYPQPGGVIEVLKDVNLALQAGEMVALLGSSGSGKTSLLQVAGLLASPTSGEVWLQGNNVSGASDAARTVLRRDTIGFVYQFHHLLPEFTAQENIAMPQMVAGKAEKEAALRAYDLLTSLGVQHRATHMPSELSGGEQQRVAIARALANSPALLLADEPTGNLDEATADAVFDALMNAVRTRNMAALVVTHNTDLAARMHRVLKLEHGTLHS
jgi:lipoprotein-releasing system ATP-binding protein